MPTWESELKAKVNLLPYNDTKTTSVDIGTSETDLLTFQPPTYFAYVEGVRLKVSNTSNVAVTIRIKGIQGTNEKLLAEVTVAAGENFEDWLRWAYDILDSGTKFNAIKVTGLAQGATATGVAVEAQVTGVYPA